MRSRTTQRDIRAAALRDELQAAGVPVLAVRPPEVPGGPTTIDLGDNADDKAIDAVLAAHDAATIDAGEAQKANLLRDAKATLRTYYQQAPATITNAQSVAAIKALIVAVRALAQLDN